ncbi:MAG: LysE family transporter [Methylotenera sp.]|nr:LysE family transporter [Oligoflexia bacterium]
MVNALFFGALFGFVSAVPIAGPASALIFNHAMEGKYRAGRLVALGAALAEGGYTLLAFWGFNALISRFRYITPASSALAAVILAVLGSHFFRSEKLRKPADARSSGEGTAELGEDAVVFVSGRRSFFLGVAVIAINPTLIATWTAGITTLYSMNLFEFSRQNSVAFSAGVCLGIFSWFSLLLKLMARFRNHLKEEVLDIGLKTIGLGMIGLSVWISFRLMFQLFKG